MTARARRSFIYSTTQGSVQTTRYPTQIVSAPTPTIGTGVISGPSSTQHGGRNESFRPHSSLVAERSPSRRYRPGHRNRKSVRASEASGKISLYRRHSAQMGDSGLPLRLRRAHRRQSDEEQVAALDSQFHRETSILEPIIVDAAGEMRQPFLAP
jgi:hypothetical protein